MMTRRIGLFVGATLVLWTSTAVWAQPARWEGIVTRSNKQKSTLTVRARNSPTGEEKVIHYDSSTHFTSQAHGDKNMKDIDASEVKDGDRVICLGAYNKNGDFMAVFISKRLAQ